MIEEIKKAKEEVAKEKEAIEKMRNELKEREENLRLKKIDLSNMEENISLDYFLKDSNVQYISLGEVGGSKREKTEKFGMVIIEHIGFPVWESYEAGNDGAIILQKDEYRRKLKSICFCGCGLDHEEQKKSGYKLEEVEDTAEICKGFFAKTIIAKCLEVAKSNEVSILFSRHADYIREMEEIYFREVVSFRWYIPIIGKNTLKSVAGYDSGGWIAIDC